MKRSVSLFEFFGFAVSTLLGTLLHFMYDWLGGALWIAPFSGVNESTAEHMKLLFWPMFIYAVIQSFFFKGYENFWYIKLKGILFGIGLIPILFYSYNGIIGKSPDWINIAIFFICAAVAYISETRAFKKDNKARLSSKTSLLILLIIGLLFGIFTFKTPKIAIFKDPISGSYGIE